MNTYFVTDAHLGSLAYDTVHDNEQKLVKWMDEIRSDCSALYFLGDMIDFWYEYKYVIPKGYARFFGKLAEFTDNGIPVYWFTGNHDVWMYSYVQEELGVVVYDSAKEIKIDGKLFFMAHGDEFFQNKKYKVIRSIFHNKTCQTLFSLLNPLIGMSFGIAWSKNSRIKDDRLLARYRGEHNEYLVDFAKSYVKEKGDEAPDFFLFGHRHIVLDLAITKKSRVIIPGDWLKEFTYGVFDGVNFVIKFYERD